MARRKAKIQIKPLTKKTWTDLVQLFNRPGGSMVRGCWCMYYRESGSYQATWGRNNQRSLKRLVDQGTTPGLIGYLDGRPVGWISVGPREDYARMKRSPVMKPVDNKPVWSMVCFFVDSKTRGQGVKKALLDGAIDYARSKGARLLEGYPIDKAERSESAFFWFGPKSLFDKAGFREVARRKPTRPVMRRGLRPS